MGVSDMLGEWRGERARLETRIRELEAERDRWRRTVRAMVDDAECLAVCDSVAHDDDCPLADPLRHAKRSALRAAADWYERNNPPPGVVNNLRAMADEPDWTPSGGALPPGNPRQETDR